MHIRMMDLNDRAGMNESPQPTPSLTRHIDDVDDDGDVCDSITYSGEDARMVPDCPIRVYYVHNSQTTNTTHIMTHLSIYNATGKRNMCCGAPEAAAVRVRH